MTSLSTTTATTASNRPHHLHQHDQHLKTLRHLGSGSYAQAYLAQHPISHHLYVIKRIPLQILTPQEKQETMREIEILQGFSAEGHLNIVRYHYYRVVMEEQMSPDDARDSISHHAGGTPGSGGIHDAADGSYEDNESMLSSSSSSSLENNNDGATNETSTNASHHHQDSATNGTGATMKPPRKRRRRRRWNDSTMRNGDNARNSTNTTTTTTTTTTKTTTTTTATNPPSTDPLLFDDSIATKHLDIIMEFCNRGNLEEYLRERNGDLLTENEVMHIFVQVAQALKHVHEKKILHRDLKAQNVFLSTFEDMMAMTSQDSLTQDTAKNMASALDERRNQRNTTAATTYTTARATNADDMLIVKLGDFGISKILDGTQALARTMVGTPYYLSPELVNDEPYGMKSDIWSLGCILYNLCTLKHAWEGRNLPALVLKIVSKDYAPIPEHYSNELKEILAKLLQKDPELRPSIQELLEMPLMKHHADRVARRIRLAESRLRRKAMKSTGNTIKQQSSSTLTSRTSKTTHLSSKRGTAKSTTTVSRIDASIRKSPSRKIPHHRATVSQSAADPDSSKLGVPSSSINHTTGSRPRSKSSGEKPTPATSSKRKTPSVFSRITNSVKNSARRVTRTRSRSTNASVVAQRSTAPSQQSSALPKEFEEGVDPSSPATIRCKLQDFSAVSEDDLSSQEFESSNSHSLNTSDSHSSPAVVRISLAQNTQDSSNPTFDDSSLEESHSSSSFLTDEDDLDPHNSSQDSDRENPPSEQLHVVRVSSKPPFYKQSSDNKKKPSLNIRTSTTHQDVELISDAQLKNKHHEHVLSAGMSPTSAASYDSFEDMYIQAQDVTEEEKQYISTWYSKYQNMIQDIQSELKEPEENDDLTHTKMVAHVEEREQQKEDRWNQRRMFYRDMLLKQHRILQENNNRAETKWNVPQPKNRDKIAPPAKKSRGHKQREGFRTPFSNAGDNFKSRRKDFLREKKQKQKKEKEEALRRKRKHQSRLKNARSRIKIDRHKKKKKSESDLSHGGASVPSKMDVPGGDTESASTSTRARSVSPNPTATASSREESSSTEKSSANRRSSTKHNRDMFREFIRRKRLQTNKENRNSKDVSVELVLDSGENDKAEQPVAEKDIHQHPVVVTQKKKSKEQSAHKKQKAFPNIELVLPDMQWVDNEKRNSGNMEHIVISKRGEEESAEDYREKFVALRLGLNPPTPTEVAQRQSSLEERKE